jgi:hypothetical protein
MCEYLTGGRLNKRIDCWNWNSKKGEGMNSSPLVLGTVCSSQQGKNGIGQLHNIDGARVRHCWQGGR